MGAAQFTVAVVVGQLRHGIHLRIADVAGRHALGLEGYEHDLVAGLLVAEHIALQPGAVGALMLFGCLLPLRVFGGGAVIGRGREVALHGPDFGHIQA